MGRPRRSERSVDTATQILDAAERLVQVRGFNAFSYADVAAELGITKASLHHHFAGKADLGYALIERYSARFADALAAIDRAGGDAPEKLDAYVRLYADVLRDRRMCLCGMLAADYETLAQPMRDSVIRFFDQSEEWLAGVLAGGVAEGTVRLSASPRVVAQAIVDALEGALLVARSYGDVGRFELAARQLLTSLAPPAAHPLPRRADRPRRALG